MGVLAAGGQQLPVFNKVIPSFGNFSGIVGGITQDKNGYLWVATSGGLYQYDGYRFKLFVNEPGNANSLSSNILETVYADAHGRIWIATWAEGLDMYDPLTGVFSHFRHDPANPESLCSDTVRTLLVDQQGYLWVGTTGGLDRYDFRTKQFKHYQADVHKPGAISCNRIRKIYQDKSGTLWVATGSVWVNEGGDTDEGGLNRYDPSRDQFVTYKHDPEDGNTLISNKVQGIFEDSRGIFWVGTSGDGLHTMDRKTGRFTRHSYDKHNPQKLSRAPLQGSSRTDHITSITEDGLGQIWIGTLENGLSRHNPQTGVTFHYSSTQQKGVFPDASAWTLFTSADGVFWVGTWQGGLFRYDPYHRAVPFEELGTNTSAFLIDRQGNFWIGTGTGLLKNDALTGKKIIYTHDPHDSSSLTHGFVRSLYEDEQGTVWIGTSNGLNRYVSGTDNFRRFMHDPADPYSIGLGEIFAVAEGGLDSLWVGSDNGLEKMHKNTGQCRHFRNIPEDSTSLSRNDITVLLGTVNQNLWVGTYPKGGLNYLDTKTNKIKRYLPEQTIISVKQSSDQTLWVGTHNNGVYFLRAGEDEFRKFPAEGTGLERTIVFAIQEDQKKNLWVRTETEIYRINPESGMINVFGLRHGVKRNNLNFNQGYRDASGKIYFGDLNGYYVFNPQDYLINNRPPKIILTNLVIEGKNVLPGLNSPLSTIIEEAKLINLAYEQNSFDINFSAIHFADPATNRLFYQMENLDVEWRTALADQQANYYSMPPGKYKFKIRAASGDGMWSEKTVDVVVHAPWWRTWWAYLMYSLTLIMILAVIHRYQKKRVIAAERERAQIRELEQAKIIEVAYQELGVKSVQLEKQKADLQATLDHLKATQTQLVHSEKMASLGELTAGIAHEIQNPLNFVNNFSELNSELLGDLSSAMDQGHADEVKTILSDMKVNLEKVTHHGKRADSIVKGMLLHARTSTGFKETVDINVLVEEYLRLAYHGLRAKEKSFSATYHTQYDPDVGVINLVPQDIGRCLLNILNNAFYAVNERAKLEQQPSSGHNYQPHVMISTKKLENEIEIKISDNGMGISADIIDRIFQPFFTTKPTGQGTGLGLSLAHDIITKGHGGDLDVESVPGHGATFMIKLPY